MVVCFNRNFWHHGQAGEKTGICKKLDARFQYGGFEWRVPAAYCFERGFTLDICRRIPRDLLQDFLDVWKEYVQEEEKLTPFQMRRIERENPQNFEADFEVELNGGQARSLGGCGLCWQPCQPEHNSPEAERPVAEYALDRTDGWEILRFHYLWPKEGPRGLNDPRLILRARRVPLPCDVSFPSAAGCAPFTVPFRHPRNGETYRIEVAGCRAEHISLSQDRERCGRPESVCFLKYRVDPALPEGEALSLLDRGEDDSPIPIVSGRPSEKPVLGIVGRAEGAAAGTPSGQSSMRSAVSAPHFAPVTRVEWRVELQTTPFAPGSFRL